MPLNAACLTAAGVDRARDANTLDLAAVFALLSPTINNNPTIHTSSLIDRFCWPAGFCASWIVHTRLFSLICCNPTAVARLDITLVLLACAFVHWALLNFISRRYAHTTRYTDLSPFQQHKIQITIMKQKLTTDRHHSLHPQQSTALLLHRSHKTTKSTNQDPTASSTASSPHVSESPSCLPNPRTPVLPTRWKNCSLSEPLLASLASVSRSFLTRMSSKVCDPRISSFISSTTAPMSRHTASRSH